MEAAQKVCVGNTSLEAQIEVYAYETSKILTEGEVILARECQVDAGTTEAHAGEVATALFVVADGRSTLSVAPREKHPKKRTMRSPTTQAQFNDGQQVKQSRRR